MKRLHSILEAISPQATLLRGFTITTQLDGSLLSSATEALPDLEIRTRFADGEVNSRIVPF